MTQSPWSLGNDFYEPLNYSEISGYVAKLWAKLCQLKSVN